MIETRQRLVLALGISFTEWRDVRDHGTLAARATPAADYAFSQTAGGFERLGKSQAGKALGGESKHAASLPPSGSATCVA